MSLHQMKTTKPTSRITDDIYLFVELQLSILGTKLTIYIDLDPSFQLCFKITSMRCLKCKYYIIEVSSFVYNDV